MQTILTEHQPPQYDANAKECAKIDIGTHINDQGHKPFAQYAQWSSFLSSLWLDNTKAQNYNSL